MDYGSDGGATFRKTGQRSCAAKNNTTGVGLIESLPRPMM
jgi:hypothetical protein